MGGHGIINLKPFVEDDTSQETLNAQKPYAINFGYFKEIIWCGWLTVKLVNYHLLMDLIA